jgi:hypothetical protein
MYVYVCMYISTSLARLRRCNVGRVSMTVTTMMMPMTARRLVRAAFDVDGDRFLDENVYPTVWTNAVIRVIACYLDKNAKMTGRERDDCNGDEALELFRDSHTTATTTTRRRRRRRRRR